MTKLLAERTIPGLHTHLISRLDNFSKETKVLDIGCGTGAWLNRLNDNGFENLIGIDQNTEQFVPAHIKVIKSNLDIDTIAITDGPFDLITAIEIIEHLSNVGKFLELVSVNLAQNGRVLISTPNVNSIASKLRLLIKNKLRHFDSHGDPTHIYPVFIHPFTTLLATYNYEIDEIWTYPQSSTEYGSTGLSKIASRFASFFIRNPYPGDVLCMMIKRKI